MARLPAAYNQRPIRRPAPQQKKSVDLSAVIVEEIATPDVLQIEVTTTETKESLQALTKAALIKKASDLGVQVSSGSKKDELVKALCEYLNL